MSDYPADLHEWVSFDDEDGDTWQFDLTFLTSNYGCIYGKGCPGVFTELAPEYEHGCCTYGAHFVDKEDRQSIRAQIDRLEPGEWELAERAAEMGGPIFKNSDGEWVTQTVDDACIFLNRPGFEHGAGCALHQAAVRRGERPLDWKPDVCWQVPIRFDEHTDDNGHTTFILREWKRRDWGEGGASLRGGAPTTPLRSTRTAPCGRPHGTRSWSLWARARINAWSMSSVSGWHTPSAATPPCSSPIRRFGVARRPRRVAAVPRR